MKEGGQSLTKALKLLAMTKCRGVCICQVRIKQHPTIIIMNPSKYFKKTWKKNDNIESNTAILPLVPYEKKTKKKQATHCQCGGYPPHTPIYKCIRTIHNTIYITIMLLL